MPRDRVAGKLPCLANMTDTTLAEAIASTLNHLASMLDSDWAALAQRLRDARHRVLDEAGSGLSDSTIRQLQDLRRGTMGSLSDVTLGSLVDGRWVVDEPRERRFHELSRELRDQLVSLPASGG
jgi:hypothetical protein